MDFFFSQSNGPAPRKRKSEISLHKLDGDSHRSNGAIIAANASSNPLTKLFDIFSYSKPSKIQSKLKKGMRYIDYHTGGIFTWAQIILVMIVIYLGFRYLLVMYRRRQTSQTLVSQVAIQEIQKQKQQQRMERNRKYGFQGMQPNRNSLLMDSGSDGNISEPIQDPLSQAFLKDSMDSSNQYSAKQPEADQEKGDAEDRTNNEGDDSQPQSEGKDNQESFLDLLSKIDEAESSKGQERIACDPQYNEKTCRMFFRVVQKYSATRILDISCLRNSIFMRHVLKGAAKHVYQLDYICASTRDEDLEKIEKSGNLTDVGAATVTYSNIVWWGENPNFPEETDLLIAWDVLNHAPYGRVWKLFENALARNIKYVLFDNYSSEKNSPSGKRGKLNVRRAPFKFDKPSLTISNMTSKLSPFVRQLMVYSWSDLNASLSQSSEPN